MSSMAVRGKTLFEPSRSPSEVRTPDFTPEQRPDGLLPGFVYEATELKNAVLS
jgi:hypothetical protein